MIDVEYLSGGRMWVLCFLLLAVRVNALPQESETTTFPSPVVEAVAIDNDVLEALEQELIKNNITLTKDVEIPEDIAQVFQHYERVQNSLSPAQPERPSLRKGSPTTVIAANALNKKTAIAAFGAGSIVTLVKAALMVIALNSGLREASVKMTNGAGTSMGNLRLRQAAAPFGPTVITGTLMGLTRGATLGISIHTLGDVTGGCSATGGHYNPFMVNHGGPTSATRHVGDLGNIVVSSGGTATVSITDSQVLLVGPTSVIGRSIVVHTNKDDLGLGGDAGSLVNGNVGAPLGCGVIGGA